MWPYPGPPMGRYLMCFYIFLIVSFDLWCCFSIRDTFSLNSSIFASLGVKSLFYFLKTCPLPSFIVSPSLLEASSSTIYFIACAITWAWFYFLSLAKYSSIFFLRCLSFWNSFSLCDSLIKFFNCSNLGNLAIQS